MSKLSQPTDKLIDPERHPKQNLPLKIIGQRVLISLDLVPYMHLLDPLALSLVTLRNPPGFIYTKKIFLSLKNALLERTFRQRFLKNEQKAKFLIRGFQFSLKQKNQSPITSIHTQCKVFPKKFNLKYVKQWFQSIKALNQHQNPDATFFNYESQFTKCMPVLFQKRRKADFRSSFRIKNVLYQILQKQSKRELKKCQQLFEKKFLKIRIPWTQNVYQNVQAFGRQLSRRFGQINDPLSKQSGLNKQLPLKRKIIYKRPNFYPRKKLQKQKNKPTQEQIKGLKLVKTIGQNGKSHELYQSEQQIQNE